MAYSLSFSGEFFVGPHDCEGVEDDSPPTSVLQALRAMSKAAWAEMAQEVFGVSGEYLDLDTVMSKIRETDTCSTLSSPVSVWIDAEGWYQVAVHDSE